MSQGPDSRVPAEARRMADRFFANCAAAHTANNTTAQAHKGGSALPLTNNHFIIGATAHNVEEALAAEAAGADYLGCGAVFATKTKKDTVPLGLDGLRAIIKAVHIPVVGIAGVTLQNYKQVLSTGANGAAVISAILGADDITAVVTEFLVDPQRPR